jgi:hypothetical protein
MSCGPERETLHEICVEMCSLVDDVGIEDCMSRDELQTQQWTSFCEIGCQNVETDPVISGENGECRDEWLAAAACVRDAGACYERPIFTFGYDFDSPECGIAIQAWSCCAEGRTFDSCG